MKYLTALLLYLSINISAQNLVPNSGFDEIIGCPDDHNQLELAFPWQSASGGVPDVFNSCATYPTPSPPFAGNYFDSYQEPRSGNGYALITVYNNAISVNSVGHSEYIQAPLIEPMSKGKQYYLEFYTSPDFTEHNNSGFTDAVGMALSDTLYYERLISLESLSIEPVIENRGTFITDTIGWTRISGCHTAKGGEQYTVIGNFRDADETQVEFVNFSFPFANSLYIEDVLVMEFDPLPDTLLLCEDGQDFTFNASFLDATYLWNTGEIDSILTTNKAGTYAIEAFMENCVLRDTVTIVDTRDIDNTIGIFEICEDEPLTLTSPLPGDIIWSDGSTQSQLIVNSSGYYSVNVNNKCGEFIFEADVTAKICECNVYVPNAFSPNFDGINDYFEIYVGCDFDYLIKNIEIFDQWGERVYTASSNDDIRWDGIFRGKALKPGVYTWYLKYDVIRDNQVTKIIDTGDVLLIR